MYKLQMVGVHQSMKFPCVVCLCLMFCLMISDKLIKQMAEELIWCVGEGETVFHNLF